MYIYDEVCLFVIGRQVLHVFYIFHRVKKNAISLCHNIKTRLYHKFNSAFQITQFIKIYFSKRDVSLSVSLP